MPPASRNYMTQAALLRRFLALTSFALAVGSFFPRDSHAYVLEGDSWPAGSTVTFQMALGNAGRTLTDGNTSWDAAAQPAPGVWDQVMQRLQFVPTINPSAPVSSGDRVNVIAFSNTVFGQSFGSGTLAVTYYRSSGSTMLEADVLFNRNQSWDSYRGPLRFGSNGYAIADIRRVLIHELGHALGLDHPDDHGQHVNAIMNSKISDLEALTTDDISGAQRLYGAAQPASTPPGASTQFYNLVYNFNQDGKPDYVFYNSSTHQTAIWYLNDNVLVSGAMGPTLPPGWRLVGVADFNGDGQADYVLFNPATSQTAIWYLSGTNLTSGAYGPTLPRGWELMAVRDLNADGKPDYVLYNASTRQTAIWYLNNNTLLSGATGPTLPVGWRLVGLADYNGDGRPDYLLYNAGTRQSAVWCMSGVNYVGGAFGPTIPAGYVLTGTADFNGDGQPDYVLYNPTTRQTAIWYLNNSTLISGKYGPTLPPNWTF
jgi:hypothetical protein